MSILDDDVDTSDLQRKIVGHISAPEVSHG
jgi:hypothetical protein